MLFLVLRYISSLLLILSLCVGNIVHALILPSAISNQVFHLDAQDINANGNFTDEPTNGSLIWLWTDSVASHSGMQSTSAKQPIYQTNSIHTYPSIYFGWVDELLDMYDHTDINLGISYPEKSFAFMIKTSADILSLQNVYEQSLKEKWYALQIDNGNLYFGVYNSDFWSSPDIYKILDLGAVNSNTYYRIIISHGTTMNGYVNGVLMDSITSVWLQTAHGQCTFDTSFDCAMFDTGGSIGIGSIQNDSLRLSTLSQILLYQWNFFSGHIGEIISWNHELTPAEVTGTDEYLQVHWGFDTTPPVITSVNIASGTLIPKWTFNYLFSYTDTGSSINTGSVWVELYSWNTGTLSWNTTNLWGIYINTGSISSNTGNININNLPFGKYRFDIIVADTAGNTLTQSYTYFVDALEWTIDTPVYAIWSARYGQDTFGTGELIVNIKTVGAGFDLSMIRTNDLTKITDVIPVYNGTNGWGYTQWNGTLFPPTITAHGTTQTLANIAKNINTNGNKNTFTYRIKYAVNPDANTPAWDYSGNIRFDINLNY